VALATNIRPGTALARDLAAFGTPTPMLGVLELHASSLWIEEMLGLELRPGRAVKLIGPALPLRGAAWETMMRLVTTWYPGNGVEATQHVLGPMEMPSAWEGIWRTTQMVGAPSLFFQDAASQASQQIARASSLRDLLDDIFRGGPLLRVIWAQGNRKIVRYGRAERWAFPHDRMDDIRWQVSFQWVSRGRKQKRAVTLRREKTNEAQTALFLEALSQIAAVDLAKLKSIDKTLLGSASAFTLGDLEGLLDAPLGFMTQFKSLATQLTSRFQDLAGLLEKAAQLPGTLSNQLLDVATNFAFAFTQASDELGRIPAELQAGQDARLASLLRAQSYFGKGQSQADFVAAAAVEVARRARRRRSNLLAQASANNATPADMLAVHLAKEGETFASISQLYYSTPDHGGEIAKANGLPAYQIAPQPGTPLIIPNLVALGSAQKL
jgi:hypothetical protein